MEDALANVCDLAVPPIIAAVIFREDHLVKGGSSPLPGHPPPDPRLGYTLLHIDVVAGQRDAPIAVGRPRDHRLGNVAGPLRWRVDTAPGGSSDLNRDRGDPPLLEEPLMGRRL